MEILLTIAWTVMVLMAMLEYGPACANLKKEEKIVIGFILICGGPLLVAGSVIEQILELFLPEGWNNGC